jgi:hypothetical protein
MPFVDRDASGSVIALHRASVQSDHEYLDVDHPDVQTFLGAEPVDPRNTFAPLDAEFVRVIEDVIDVLIARHVISITDLPVEAQGKLLRRKGARDGLGRVALELFSVESDRGVI